MGWVESARFCELVFSASSVASCYSTAVTDALIYPVSAARVTVTARGGHCVNHPGDMLVSFAFTAAAHTSAHPLSLPAVA